ncbi:MAG: DUF1707 SHOCT-like domain-containing protein [Jatrophihabitans sp.]
MTESDPVEHRPDRSADLRASDQDRTATADRLGDACAAGRLTLAEFTDRVGLAHRARTLAELTRRTGDLPSVATAWPAPARRRGWSVSLIGDVARRGRWRLAPRMSFVTATGDVDLDLTDVELQARSTVITVVGLLSDLTVTVPAGVGVEVGGFAVIGDRRVSLAERDVHHRRTAPTIRLRLFTGCGDLVVVRTAEPLPS